MGTGEDERLGGRDRILKLGTGLGDIDRVEAAITGEVICSKDDDEEWELMKGRMRVAIARDEAFLSEFARVLCC